MAWAAMIASKTTTVPPRLLLDLLGARCEDSRWNTLPRGRGQPPFPHLASPQALEPKLTQVHLGTGSGEAWGELQSNL